MTATLQKTTGSEVQFWNNGWSPDGMIEIPTGYDRLEAGSRYATRIAKQLTKAMGRTVFIEMKKSKKNGYSTAVAYWVPARVIREARDAERETESRRAASREVGRKSRARKHERDLNRLVGRLGELLPGMPEREREGMVRHAFEVGSDRVGRTTRLEEDKKLELAVRAHVRHEHTDYEPRLAMGEDREDVRRDLREEIDWIVEGWRQPKHTY